MWIIILTILKIIGRILFVILGLLLLAFLVILFVPIRYQASGYKKEDGYQVQGLVSYLYPLIRVRVQYPGRDTLLVQVLWFTVYRLSLDKPAASKEEPVSPRETAQETGESVLTEQRAEAETKDGHRAEAAGTPKTERMTEKTEKIDADLKAAESDKSKQDKRQADLKGQPETAGQSESKRQPEAGNRSQSEEQPSARREERPEGGGQEKAGRQPEGNKRDEAGRQPEGNGQEKAEGQSEGNEQEKAEGQSESNTQDTHAPKKEPEASGGVMYYIQLLRQNRGLIREVLQIVLKACKSILPRRFHGKVTLGTGRADITGYIYGLFTTAASAMQWDIHMEPVWLEPCLEGTFSLKGRIRICSFACAAVRIIMNKDVRILYKKIRRV